MTNKYTPSPSKSELSYKAERNLYELGLLSRPKDRIRNTGAQSTGLEQRKTLLCAVSSL